MATIFYVCPTCGREVGCDTDPEMPHDSEVTDDVPCRDCREKG